MRPVCLPTRRLRAGQSRREPVLKQQNPELGHRRVGFDPEEATLAQAVLDTRDSLGAECARTLALRTGRVLVFEAETEPPEV